ncbi:protein phosphatase 2C, putative [Entamoeba invadens IP1]|uniref:protein-serine/threonine phosphatase n=1 Tax=Entamoeba invadens IP1 TaxID=370355 RepID=A0A0A1UHA5_ENTIV|nr:protein phosphatase 2C, putative [Entamoeba invadens IP1]ELP94982.1 protein phosphatase 2C, putative [Entamoeba invadens IP1]|eukprot:XP_004261753.1 protein phosphatase 2C, putative [Entamoeba invadens IP1]
MGEFLSTPNTNQESSRVQLNSTAVAYGSMQGWRKEMEDAHIITSCENYSMVGVYDGHGGPQVSKYLSLEMKKALMNSSHFATSIQDALKETYLSLDATLKTPQGSKMLNDAVHSELYEKSVLSDTNVNLANTIGSTALTALFDEYQLTIANVGDCRCVLVKRDETLQLTTDQRLNVKAEADRVVACGGRVVNGRVNGDLMISRAFGDTQFKKGNNPEKYIVSATPEITTYDFDGSEEFMIIACDGIFDVMSNDEVVSFVKECLDGGILIDQICKMILNKCLAENPYEQPGTDNMTFLLAVFDKSDKWRKCCAGCDVIS